MSRIGSFMDHTFSFTMSPDGASLKMTRGKLDFKSSYGSTTVIFQGFNHGGKIYERLYKDLFPRSNAYYPSRRVEIKVKKEPRQDRYGNFNLGLMDFEMFVDDKLVFTNGRYIGLGGVSLNQVDNQIQLLCFGAESKKTINNLTSVERRNTLDDLEARLNGNGWRYSNLSDEKVTSLIRQYKRSLNLPVVPFEPRMVYADLFGAIISDDSQYDKMMDLGEIISQKEFNTGEKTGLIVKLTNGLDLTSIISESDEFNVLDVLGDLSVTNKESQIIKYFENNIVS